MLLLGERWSSTFAWTWSYSFTFGCTSQATQVKGLPQHAHLVFHNVFSLIQVRRIWQFKNIILDSDHTFIWSEISKWSCYQGRAWINFHSPTVSPSPSHRRNNDQGDGQKTTKQKLGQFTDQIGILKYTKIDYISGLFYPSTKENWPSFHQAFPLFKCFLVSGQLLLQNPFDLTFSRAMIFFFFFSLKEEDYRIKNEEFLKTPEFAPHKMMGRTNLEA